MVSVPRPIGNPADLAFRYKRAVRSSDSRVPPDKQPLVVAALVAFRYHYEAIQDSRRARALLQEVLALLAPRGLARHLATKEGCTALAVALRKLLDSPTLTDWDPSWEELSRRQGVAFQRPFVEGVSKMIALLETPPGDLADQAGQFRQWLEAEARKRVGPGTTIFFSIPGVGRFIGPPRQAAQSREAEGGLALALVEILRTIFGSSRNSVDDAHKIICTAFEDEADLVQEFEALRRAHHRTMKAVGWKTGDRDQPGRSLRLTYEAVAASLGAIATGSPK